MNVVRKGDLNNKGGIVKSTKNQNVFVDSILVSTMGDPVIYTSNKPPTTTGKGSNTVFINGIEVIRKGDKDIDGSVRVNGSQNVLAN